MKASKAGLDKPFAIKMIKVPNDTYGAKKVLREISILRQLGTPKGHPFITNIHDIIIDEENNGDMTVFLVLDYMECTMRSLINDTEHT